MSKPKFFIFGEDYAAAIVGPYESRSAAAAHVRMAKKRGDGAENRVVTEAELPALREEYEPALLELTPDEFVRLLDD
jgi:hypothetical protein